MPSVARPLRLRPLAGPRPLVRFMTWTLASKPAAVWTKRAAGRACSPRGFRMSRRSVRPSSRGAEVPAGPGAAGSPAPSWAVFPCSPPRASFATPASGSPSLAATAAATAPSTSGASQRSTDSRCSGVRKSSAVSALRTALPRSISTSTPSPESARPIASITRTASVPSAPSSASPPASSSFTSGPAISAASSRTPAASVLLCETITIPTISALRRAEPVGAVEELDRVDRVDLRAVLDLPAAGLAVAGGEVAVRLPQLAEEPFANRHRDLVLLLLEDIRAGDAAAVGIELDRAQPRDEGQEVECGLADSVALLLARGVVGHGQFQRPGIRAELA